MSKPLFKMTIEAHGDTDGDHQPEVVFDADFLGMDIVRFRKNVPLGQALKLFAGIVEPARKVLGF
jgi:hypothetical protein